MGKSVKKIVKSVAKVVTAPIKAPIKAATSLLKGDIKGTLNGLTEGATGGLVSLQGKDALINTKLLETPKVIDTSNAVKQTDAETDGLLQYVSDLRTRKARRNRASTDNTGNSNNTSANKLSGVTALGV